LRVTACDDEPSEVVMRRTRPRRVLDRLAEQAEPWPEAIRLDTTGEPHIVVHRAADRVRARLWRLSETRASADEDRQKER
jgi:hypothetical protein